MRWLIPFLLFSVTGCIPYPIYKTLQPEAQMRVIDHENKPLSEATVTLISIYYPYGREDFRETRLTDSLGVAEFTGKSEWRIELMALHGWREYFWHWCVEKPGYATFVIRHNFEREFDDEAEVKLNPGISTPCPGPRF